MANPEFNPLSPPLRSEHLNPVLNMEFIPVNSKEEWKMQGKYYYISLFRRGIYCLHKEDCTYLPLRKDRQFIGTFYSDHGALTHTRSMGLQCWFCVHCCPDKGRKLKNK